MQLGQCLQLSLLGQLNLDKMKILNLQMRILRLKKEK